LAPGGNQFASAPFYTLNEKGKKGMGRRQCTREYKITPIAKKIREIMGYKPRQKMKKINGLKYGLVYLWMKFNV
jgi:hypothetical protein